jgi:hypothetical protein
LLQVAAAQVVPTAYFWQAPAPSHLLFVPQVAAPASLQMLWGSAPPAATEVHFPSEPVIAQLWQAPAQAVAQQTPSAQCWFWQSASALQVCPSAFLPQVPAVAPLATVQTWPVAQSVLLVAVVQLSLHAPSAHWKLPQENVAAARHTPRPSQVRVDVPAVALVQAAAPHGLLRG